MTRATNSGHPGAGQFATSRRGGVSMSDIWQAQEAIGQRATPSMIARYLGRCEIDVRSLMFGAASAEPAPAPAAPVSRVRPWTAQEIRMLQVMYQQAGTPVPQIAITLERTERAVTARIQRDGLASRRSLAA